MPQTLRSSLMHADAHVKKEWRGKMRGVLSLSVVAIIVSFIFMVVWSNRCTLSQLRRSVLVSASSDKQSCITTLANCDLACLDWTIVLSMGRSGSTTVQEMISKLPGMNFYGEEGGLLRSIKDAQDKISKRRLSISWRGSEDKNVSTIACMTQKFYSERHGQTCLERGCRHGWKEIRYRSADEIHLLQTFFPAARIILNYRDKCEQNYTDVFNRDCSRLDAGKEDFLKNAKILTNSFHLKFEDIDNLERYNELSVFLGYDCKALHVLSYNTNRSYNTYRTSSKLLRGGNPWDCA